MSEEHSTFSDETTTGRESDAFRKLGRATIGARASSDDDFEWLVRFRRDYLHNQLEPKSEVVLQIADTRNDAKELVFQNIGNCAVFIVDLSESTRRLLAEVFALMGKPPPSLEDAVDFISKNEKLRHLIGQFLRRARDWTLYSTPIPTAEAILRNITGPLGICSSDKDTLVDREALRELDQQSFNELVARFSTAFADALNPKNQASVITEGLKEQRYISPEYLSYLTLGGAASVRRFFDFGDSKAFSLLEDAHHQVIEQLEEASERYFWKKLKGGSVEQEDSRQLLGIQVADIAAAIAAREYERFPSDRRAGGEAIKRVFDKVFCNRQWL